MKSPNERIKEWYAVVTDETRAKLEWLFGDLDQPVTDIMWILAGKFLHDLPREWLASSRPVLPTPLSDVEGKVVRTAQGKMLKKVDGSLVPLEKRQSFSTSSNTGR
jgi:hypothetical protein